MCTVIVKLKNIHTNENALHRNESYVYRNCSLILITIIISPPVACYDLMPVFANNMTKNMYSITIKRLIKTKSRAINILK
jgi:hypothetical protein